MVNVVRFGLLGPLLVEHNGYPVDVPGQKKKALLVALLARPNQVVTARELADVLWNGKPPASAVTTLRSHVKHLRRSLGRIGPERIATYPSGYLIRIEDATELDIAAFTDGIHRGRAGMLDNDWPTAIGELHAALALWRGRPLADVHADHFRRTLIPDLHRIRLQAELWYTEAMTPVAVSGP